MTTLSQGHIAIELKSVHSRRRLDKAEKLKRQLDRIQARLPLILATILARGGMAKDEDFLAQGRGLLKTAQAAVKLLPNTCLVRNDGNWMCMASIHRDTP